MLCLSDDEFEFRVVGSVRELESRIRVRATEGETARSIAGFCWPWSDRSRTARWSPTCRCRLVHALEREGRCPPPGPGIPKSDFWASDPTGIDQVGCVYTAQGFEFDYVGVIFGRDLVYRAA